MAERRGKEKDNEVSVNPDIEAEVGVEVEETTEDRMGTPGEVTGAAVSEPPQEAIKRLEAELDEMRDRYLRTAAEFDNFRKRTSRERLETWNRAQADVVSNILDALDDLGRVSELDPESTAAEDVVAGVELVERKLLRELQSAGLKRIGEVDETFDPNVHEAVATVPAASPEEDHTIAQVLKPGYEFGGALIRAAIVQVRVWQDTGDQIPAGEGGNS